MEGQDVFAKVEETLRRLATDLIADWLSGAHTYGDWARLEALARECSNLIQQKGYE